MSIEDIKTMTVKVKNLYILFSVEVFILIVKYINQNSIIENIKVFIITTVIGVILYYLFKGEIGGGDIKLLIILSLFFQKNIINIIFYASLLGIVYSIIIKNKKRKIPFIPFIEGGIICQLFINYLVN